MPKRRLWLSTMAPLMAFAWLAGAARAQTSTDKTAHTQHPKSEAKKPAATDQSLSQQMEDLKRQLAELQTAARQNKPPQAEKPVPARGKSKARGGLAKMGMAPGTDSGMAMSMPAGGHQHPGKNGPMAGGGKGAMSGSMPKEKPSGAMAGGMEGEMGSMPKPMEGEMSGSMAKPTQGGMTDSSAPPMEGEMAMPMDKPDGEMGSMEPGMMGMGSMEPPMPVSALPGFPGSSHIYHVGATGFFLDYADNLDLAEDQQRRLSRIREHALMQQDDTQRQIDKAEQELWSLTASDQPDSGQIETKAREIERLRATQRLAFIQSVGEATSVLTNGQRSKVLGGPSKASADSPKMKM